MENHGKLIIFFKEKQLFGLGSQKCPVIACLFAYSLIQLSVINIYLAQHAKHCAKSRDRNNNKANTFLISRSVNHFFPPFSSSRGGFWILFEDSWLGDSSLASAFMYISFLFVFNP